MKLVDVNSSTWTQIFQSVSITPHYTNQQIILWIFQIFVIL